MQVRRQNRDPMISAQSSSLGQQHQVTRCPVIKPSAHFRTCSSEMYSDCRTGNEQTGTYVRRRANWLDCIYEIGSASVESSKSEHRTRRFRVLPRCWKTQPQRLEILPNKWRPQSQATEAPEFTSAQKEKESARNRLPFSTRVKLLPDELCRNLDMALVYHEFVRTAEGSFREFDLSVLECNYLLGNMGSSS